jgi:hypothetical protein
LASPTIRLLLNTGDTMADASLDSLVFTPVVAGLEPRSRNLSAQNGNLSRAFSGGPETLQHDSRHSATGASRDDAFLISSDDESDYDYLDEDQSNTSYPSMSELRLPAGRGDGKFSSIPGGMYLNSHPSASRCAETSEQTKVSALHPVLVATATRRSHQSPMELTQTMRSPRAGSSKHLAWSVLQHHPGHLRHRSLSRPSATSRSS